MSLSAARSRVMFANENLATPGRLGEVEPLLQAAEGFLAEVEEPDKAGLLAEIARIRAELAAMPSEEETRLARAALGKVSQAREQIERGYGRDDVLATLRAGEEFLQRVREQFAAPARDEIGELRERLGAPAEPLPAPAPDPAPPTGARGPSEDEERALSAARRLL